MLVAVLDWAVAHPPLDQADRCRVRIARPGGDDAIEPLNAEGVLEVSAVAVAELGAALGLSTDSARRLVAEVLELSYRLPAVWERVLDGRVPIWQARRIAASTQPLATLAARYVDRHLGAAVGRVSIAQVERLVTEAVARYDLALKVEQIGREVDRRRFDVDLDLVSLDGQVPVHGLVDLPDAIALDAALAHAATELAALGSTDSLDARRARGLGDMAREHLELWGQEAPSGRVVVDTDDWTVTPVDTPARVAGTARSGGTRVPRRQLVLHVHLSAATIQGGVGTAAGPFGRVDNGNDPVTAETIRRWCGDASTKLTVLPVLDLAEHIHHAGYEVPTRLREQIIARDVTCAFPGCQVPARRCDLDHIVPYDHERPERGGQTETSNLAPLCRRHHRLKTTGRIGYRMVRPGVFEWWFPEGTRVVRGPLGVEACPAPPEP